MAQPKLGLFGPLTAKPIQIDAVSSFLLKGYELVQDPYEPETLQWFAIKYSTDAGNQYAIFDTFAAESGLEAHLNGKVAEALMANRDTLLVEGDEAVNIRKVDVLASKVNKVGEDLKKGLINGLRVLLKAKEGKAEAVKEFLTGAVPLVEAEVFTPVWFAISFPDTNEFGIIDFFENEDGRNQHLTGKVAAALFANAPELLEGSPEVVKVDVLAAKI